MKRDHPQHPHLPHCQQQPPPGGTFPMDAKGKMMMMDDQLDAGEDELLAALGYKVRASSMADVAQKLEQLEMAMAMGGASSAGGVGVAAGGGALDDNAVLSHLASETVHYNPSDLSSWLENMLSELNVPPLPPPPPPPLQQPVDVRGGRHEHHLPPPPPPPLPAVLPLIIDDPLAPAESSVTSVDFPSPSTKRVVDYDDLSAIIPGGLAAYGSSTESAADPDADTRERKRIKSTASSTVPPPTSKASASPPPPPPPSTTEGAPLPVVLVDSQETGIRLVHTLLACAEAVQQENRAAAEALVKQIGVLAMSQGGAMRKVSTYFAEALARRIYRIYPQQDPSLDSAFSDLLQMHFYEACPYLKFAHFTANQAILEAFAGKARVHVIDFGMKQGMQWPALMQALALRPGGPPSFRLTGIGPPQPDNTDALQQVGYKLAQLAEEIHVEFEYRGYVANSLADLEPYMLQLGCRGGGSSVAASNSSSSNSTPSCNPSAAHEEEVVAVNSVFELHRLLGQQGAIEKVLGTVKAVRPSIVTVVEQEANHNGPVFLERFTEALHYYSSMFDSLESGCGGNNSNGSAGGVGGDTRDQVMTEVYLGRQICNVVACEGAERTERHETTAQWRGRMGTAGFELVPLGSNAFKQASMLLELFAGGDGYRVEEKEGCLMLGWHTRPLITTSAWRLPSSPGGCAQRSGGRGNP